MRSRDDRHQELDQLLFRERQRQQKQRRQDDGQRLTKPGRPDADGVRTSRIKPVSRQPARPHRSRRLGVVALSVFLLLFAAVLVYQLYQIQIVNYAANAKKAAELHYKPVTENPRRGQITDRNGIELAGTTYVYRIGITPKDMRSITQNITADQIAANIAECLNMDPSKVRANMDKIESVYIQLKKDVPRDEADALKAYIKKADIGGIRIDSEPRRYYTNGSLASQVLGYTRFSDEKLIGQLGIELEYDTVLTGQPGYTYVETDNYGNKGELPFSVPINLRAKDGQNVILNLDVNIQKIAQEELANAINVYDITSGGTIIIMNPYTGAILAMASYPFFNSSDPAARPDIMDKTTWDKNSRQKNIDFLSSQVWRNRAISDTYEPGSTMKAITASIALEEGLTKEKEMMNDASISLYDWTIRCYHAGGHGKETLEQGFWRSCNPIFAQLSLRTGVSRFYDYVRAFGFMGTTGIDLPAEGTGILHQDPTEIDMATLSYGESSTVTPIQLATSYCVFANGGNLVKPSIVKAITDSEGAIVREFQPETIRKVISENTAARIRELMKGVVTYGTGSAAYVEGYAVAGKTSTSTDDFGDHTLSFAGFAPADSPEIVALVVLNKPEDKELTSKGAAKTCGQVISRTLEYMGVSREYSDKDISRLNTLAAVPDVTGLTYAEARKELAKQGFRVEAGDSAMGDATLVKYQWPAAKTELHSKGLVVLYAVPEPDEVLMVIPDFTGKNVNECLSSAAESGLNIRIVGDCLGVAISQYPRATYTEVDPGVAEIPVETGTATSTTASTAAKETTAGTASGPTSENTGGAPGETTATSGSDQAVTHLKRGSIISIRFAAVEEEVAQTGETE